MSGDGREHFENLMRKPPFERNTDRHSKESATWPLQYKDYQVQLAWQFFCAGRMFEKRKNKNKK